MNVREYLRQLDAEIEAAARKAEQRLTYRQRELPKIPASR